jgi:Tfp pilus assembly protein PilF
MYLNRGLLDDAEREYLTALNIEPTAKSVHISLGRVYERSGKPEEAQKQYAIANAQNQTKPAFLEGDKMLFI